MPRMAPDVVLSDFKMPGMDGLAFLARVRAAYPDAVLILLTGYADKESAIRAINEVGIWQYVEKPWDLGELLLSEAEPTPNGPEGCLNIAPWCHMCDVCYITPVILWNLRKQNGLFLC